MKRAIIGCCTCLVFFACGTKDNLTVPEEPSVNKTVRFEVAASKDYSMALYDKLQVKVNLTIARSVLSTGQDIIVWDTIIPLQSIRNFPSLSSALVVEKRISPVKESKEVIKASYAISYDDNGLKSAEAMGLTLPGGPVTQKLEVHL